MSNVTYLSLVRYARLRNFRPTVATCVECHLKHPTMTIKAQQPGHDRRLSDHPTVVTTSPPIAANRMHRMSSSAGTVDGEPSKATRITNNPPSAQKSQNNPASKVKSPVWRHRNQRLGESLHIRSPNRVRLASLPIVFSMIKCESTQQPALLSSTLTTSSNIKIIPANQLIQLKPFGLTQ
ncbi:hypothetical protein quinque_011063 [Culex quinquefasciatus]